MNTFPVGMLTRDALQQYARDYLTIECGDWTYGQPSIQLDAGDLPRRLVIGRYCSIATDVTIFVGRFGRHLTGHLTTYPLQMAVSPEVVQAEGSARPIKDSIYYQSIHRDLDVEIGADVWIGTRAIIMAGVKIGTGAIVGAGALVTKDVPPYGIALGVPAVVTRFRHDEQTVARLLATKWWEQEPDELWRLLGKDFDYVGVDVILQKLEGARSSDAPPASRPAESSAATTSLEPDLSNAPAVLGRLTPVELTVLLEQGTGSLPVWPSQEDQQRYTGGHGVALLERAKNFAELMQADGVFADGWRGLDFGCGWGRIASYLLTKGRPEQLDLCDAWEPTVNLIRGSNYRNRIWQVSEMLSDQDIPASEYDFIYAFSVFTHLTKEAFEHNIERLMRGLKPSGKLYFTVRHEEFAAALADNTRINVVLDDSGFWSIAYPDQVYYGETIVTQDYLESRYGSRGTLRYLGAPEAYQHVYSLSR